MKTKKICDLRDVIFYKDVFTYQEKQTMNNTKKRQIQDLRMDGYKDPFIYEDERRIEDKSDNKDTTIETYEEEDRVTP